MDRRLRRHDPARPGRRLGPAVRRRSLRPGDSVAVLVAGRARSALWSTRRASTRPGSTPSPRPGSSRARGSSDIPAALAEAFRVLERTRNPGRDVIVLTDGQRHAWRPGESGRWALVRDLHRRLAVPARGLVDRLGRRRVRPTCPTARSVRSPSARALVTPGLPIDRHDDGRERRPRPALPHGRAARRRPPVAGSAQAVGPIPAGGRAPLSFRTSLTAPGSHLLTVRLDGVRRTPRSTTSPTSRSRSRRRSRCSWSTASPARSPSAARPISSARPWLRPATRPRRSVPGSSPPGNSTPTPSEARSVVVLANVDRLTPEQVAALGAVPRRRRRRARRSRRPGRRPIAQCDSAGCRPSSATGKATRPLARRSPTRAPARSAGPLLSPFGQGDDPAARPRPTSSPTACWPDRSGASVSARLDTGDPWVVERPSGRGRVLRPRHARSTPRRGPCRSTPTSSP